MTPRLKRILAVGTLLILAALGWRWWRETHGHAHNGPPESGPAMSDERLAGLVHVPEGFSIRLFATGVPSARMLRFTAAGDLLVSATSDGSVVLLNRDADGDGCSDGKRVLLKQLNLPHGLALHDGWLYVAENETVLRVRFDAVSGTTSGAPEYIIRDLPGIGGHATRTIDFGPDGWLYVSAGSSCNVCLEDNPKRATIMRYQADGSGGEVFARGLRNSVGFTWQPGTGAMFATDNGRDFLGDDFPPCELNRIVAGGFYGWPFANGDRVADPDFGKGHEDEIARSLPPVHGFGAHVAPLGLTFYSGDRFPQRYRDALFVAQHGSWNRSRRSGYRVVTVFLGADGATREEDFAVGFENDRGVAGRPVDVAVGPDGALYVSDDFSGSVYRIAYTDGAAG